MLPHTWKDFLISGIISPFLLVTDTLTSVMLPHTWLGCYDWDLSVHQTRSRDINSVMLPHTYWELAMELSWPFLLTFWKILSKANTWLLFTNWTYYKNSIVTQFKVMCVFWMNSMGECEKNELKINRMSGRLSVNTRL